MPTITKTLPLSPAVVNRLASQMTAVRPEPEYYGSESNSTCLEPRDIKRWTAIADGVSTRQPGTYSWLQSVGCLVFAVAPLSAPQEIWAIGRPFISSGLDDTYPLDANEILNEQRLMQESEWEEYEEPLWDPMRAEVSSMVREFYEQYASAPSDHALQHNKGNAIPLESQADSSSSSENLDLTQTGHEVESEIRLVPPPTPEYRVKVKFRFTGEDTPRIHTDPDLT